ncbi:Uncharacterized conserved protein YdeI, YjbR/CyaY-like superfamily, DUF1801 family [Actinopolymorpha cephalotaxi]|uniref:Uncharacterized conserved protein YdeI, YjbR/CyaY-like superfamily, DUF1801 family n=1 Tax=Actinopolymorpha cephalotaxi TaxID=504797 RepID=A0A1I2W649_9ACTN|nr:YdeI/OmpD-associated family protein [Actinopolymorpha cephalotaxi]NYH82733.1 uncharacterized protein YdeI (YjbR/CyaY-like superfamily) [Actinopolymorpha cephalotaxi]SFG96843.1 Uncharacterized conserved protein YdeI, YjbR/CyaY-like superfamily, DUF1801 family [Actinopolymorpha cephalotaxi]
MEQDLSVVVDAVDAVVARTASEWRAWLTRHSRTEKETWLVIQHKDSGTPSVRYAEAIEQALCFGWIDGLHRRNDVSSSRLRFSPRTPRSTWSPLNRRRAERMIELGRMTEQGRAVVDLARANGTWQVLPDGDGSDLPEDLRVALAENPSARANFQAFAPSSRRLILGWIATAKRPDTRRRRITRTVDLAAVGLRAQHAGDRVPVSPGRRRSWPR